MITVSTLIRRLSEFVETESGSCNVVVYNKVNDRLYDITTAEKQDIQGQIYFEICLDKLSRK